MTRKLLICLILSSRFWIQDSVRAADDISSLPVEVNGDQVQYFESEKKVVAEGNVVVKYKDINMTCKKVTAFLDSKEATAEGDVVITRGEELLRGEKIIYNFQAETGTIYDGVAKSDVWYGGGKVVNKTSPQEAVIQDGYITTCDRIKPHYKIASRQVKIYFGKRIVARNVTFNVGGVPIMYLPVYSQPVKENIPKISLVPGQDKRWGPYILSSYRYNLADDLKGNVHLDYRRDKGLAEGVDVNYESKMLGKMYLRAYYMDERDRKADTDKERWRVQYRQKWDVLPDTTAVIEYHRMKDKDFIKDYYYREEFERDPQPDTYASVVYAKPAYTGSVLVNKRVNRFFTDTERLPDADLNIKDQRIFEKMPFFYKGDFDFVDLNKKFANSDQTNHATRFDTYNQVSMPLRILDFLSVDPYAATQQTYYSRQLYTAKDKIRGTLYTGADISMNFFRVYDYKTDFLGLDVNGFRHIFMPNINYYYIHKPTLAPEELYDFDETDEVDKKNGVGLFLENKLQVKRLNDKNEPYTSELMRFVMSTDYLVHKEDDKRFSDLTGDLELKPYEWLFMKQTALYDLKWGALRSLNTDISARDSKKGDWRIGAGHRFEQHFSSQFTGEAETKIMPGLKCRVYERYEFKGGEFKEQEYAITKDLHCWEAEVAYNVREKDTHTFWIIFRLKALPDLPLKLGTSYYKPRTGAAAD